MSHSTTSRRKPKTHPEGNQDAVAKLLSVRNELKDVWILSSPSAVRFIAIPPELSAGMVRSARGPRNEQGIG